MHANNFYIICLPGSFLLIGSAIETGIKNTGYSLLAQEHNGIRQRLEPVFYKRLQRLEGLRVMTVYKRDRTFRFSLQECVFKYFGEIIVLALHRCFIKIVV